MLCSTMFHLLCCGYYYSNHVIHRTTHGNFATNSHVMCKLIESFFSEVKSFDLREKSLNKFMCVICMPIILHIMCESLKT